MIPRSGDVEGRARHYDQRIERGLAERAENSAEQRMARLDRKERFSLPHP
jgi:hypothetical protein